MLRNGDFRGSGEAGGTICLCIETESCQKVKSIEHRAERFYCGLNNCTSIPTPGYNFVTEYNCSKTYVCSKVSDGDADIISSEEIGTS